MPCVFAACVAEAPPFLAALLRYAIAVGGNSVCGSALRNKALVQVRARHCLFLRSRRHSARRLTPLRAVLQLITVHSPCSKCRLSSSMMALITSYLTPLRAVLQLGEYSFAIYLLQEPAKDMLSLMLGADQTNLLALLLSAVCSPVLLALPSRRSCWAGHRRCRPHPAVSLRLLLLRAVLRLLLLRAVLRLRARQLRSPSSGALRPTRW